MNEFFEQASSADPEAATVGLEVLPGVVDLLTALQVRRLHGRKRENPAGRILYFQGVSPAVVISGKSSFHGLSATSRCGSFCQADSPEFTPASTTSRQATSLLEELFLEVRALCTAAESRGCSVMR